LIKNQEGLFPRKRENLLKLLTLKLLVNNLRPSNLVWRRRSPNSTKPFSPSKCNNSVKTWLSGEKTLLRMMLLLIQPSLRSKLATKWDKSSKEKLLKRKSSSLKSKEKREMKANLLTKPSLFPSQKKLLWVKLEIHSVLRLLS
jgi:hypothetical protein